MTIARYALRTTAFAAAFLLVSWAASGPVEVFSSIAVAALWIVAQARAGLRRFDVIALGTTAMVVAVLQGTGMLMALVTAIAVILPAVVFAELLDRWVPGWWQGRADRFRKQDAVLGRIISSAMLAAVTAVVLRGVIDPSGFDLSGTAVALARDGASILILTVAVRAIRQARRPRRPVLSVVR
ncbi:hypothetical protein [Actinoplanes sp. NBRC 101535]|uniref:hypothetical protein n=1 Tax=Actinoplanes sp. NBRC 101535 TaxID=3032196 RepID=UPI0024A0A0A4|nr:hypothetical protein [Actinoplanes sp. NBRC 101535]GLY04169.1 hypothetical protein Acsp01_45480 [Actinoplanes sp. NBRC 101535]